MDTSTGTDLNHSSEIGGAGTPKCHRNKRKSKSSSENLVKINDFTRPNAEKEDLVVVLKGEHARLAYVTDIDHKLRNNPMYEHMQGGVLTVELLPSGYHLKRSVEEALVVDRGFSVGETVVKFINEHINSGDESLVSHRFRKNGMIGQITNVRTVGDVLALPTKDLVVRNVDLSRSSPVELINFNSAHNYFLYENFIGDLRDVQTEVTLSYRGMRFVVKEGGESGVYLQRKDRGDDGKSLVQGEIVQISSSDLKSAKWANGIPLRIRKFLRQASSGHMISAYVEKVEPHTAFVRWITGLATFPTETEISKENLHKIKTFDLSANARISSADRVVIKTSETDELTTLDMYNKWLDEEFLSKFQIPKKKDKSLGTSSRLSGSLTRRRCRSEGSSDQTNNLTETPCPSFVEKSFSLVKSISNTLYGAFFNTQPSLVYDGQPPQKNSRISEEKEKDAVAEGDQSPTVSPMETIHEHADEGDDARLSMESSSESSAEEERSSSRKARHSRFKKCRNTRRPRRVVKPPLVTISETKALKVLGESFVGEVLFSRTLVDVEWVDGTVEENIPGYSLVPVDPDLDQQDHLPGTLVARKETKSADELSQMGVILSIDTSERSANIRWFNVENEEPTVVGEEMCTLFDIMVHPVYVRMMLGGIGSTTEREPNASDDYSNVLFQVVGTNPNGKQLVKFFNGETAELFCTKTIPVFVADDEAQDDEDSSGSEETTDDEGSVVNFAMDAYVEHAKGEVEPKLIIQFSPDYVSEMKEKIYDSEDITKRAFFCAMFMRNFILTSNGEDGATLNLCCKSRNEISEFMHGVSLLEKGTELREDLLAVVVFTILNFNTEQFAGDNVDLNFQLERLGSGVSEGNVLYDLARYVFDTAGEGKDNSSFDAMRKFAKNFPSCPQSLEMERFAQDLRYVIDERFAEHSIIEEGSGSGEKETAKIEPVENKDTTVADVEMADANEVKERKSMEKGVLTMLDECPDCVSWFSTPVTGASAGWTRAVVREHRRLASDLPHGVFVTGFTNRLDLLTAVIVGPEETPFEGTPFHFDIRFPQEYPVKPPEVKYKAYSKEQLNPNLYQNGKVCTSLLGTWQGKGIETWGPQSTLIQVLVSIQGLILVSQPYFNEAGYESRKGAPSVVDNSKRYNEMAAINSLEYMNSIVSEAPPHTKTVVKEVVSKSFPILREKLVKWTSSNGISPAFPVQMSKGFLMAVEKHIKKLDATISESPLMKAEGEAEE